MVSRSLRIGTLFLVGLALTGLGMAAGTPSGGRIAEAGHAAATQLLKVSVGDGWTFSLSADEVTPGDTVTVTITSLGTSAHTFTLSAIKDLQFNKSDSDAHLNAFFAAHPPLVNLTINGSVGESHSQTFVAPAFGLYEYVCLQSGHFSLGMLGFLGSGEHGSAVSADTGPGWQVFAIGGGIAALVVATIVLAFVIGQRPGAKHEMPPERLGYPEQPKEPPAH